MDVGAKPEQQGSCVGHECINKSFLTCEAQPWKDFFFNVFLLVLSSACDLSAEILVLYECKKSVFFMSGEGELWDIAAWLAGFHAQ